MQKHRYHLRNAVSAILIPALIGMVGGPSALAASENVLWSFGNGTDGYYANTGVIIDSSGNLYGATSGGGSYGYGTLYKYAPDGSETLLWNFGNGKDGQLPLAVIMDKKKLLRHDQKWRGL